MFVSSTISECAGERIAAREAIRSLNQVPILFEDVGARPYPPREVYKPRLEDSHIFIAIYKSSYGWVAPNSDISGIHDEFQIASSRGMDRLIYVMSGVKERDKCLEVLIEKAKGEVTIAYCSDSNDLKERIRDNLTAVISTRFVDQSIIVDDVIGPMALIDAILPTPEQRFCRQPLEARAVDAIGRNGRLLITGSLGAGKTIFLAQLAARYRWIFVNGQGLSRLDLLARSANAVRAQIGKPAATFTSDDTANAALLDAWAASEGVTLAVDDPVDARLLWDLLGGTNKNRLVMTSRKAAEIPVSGRLELPPLDGDEIAAWVTTFRNKPPAPRELATLVSRSAGNPLYLRFYLQGELDEANLTLREVEIRASQSAQPRAREILSYLALAGTSLSIADLLALLGTEDQGPEVISDLLGEIGALLKQGRGHAELVHEHLRETLIDELKSAPAKLGFFGNRLGRYLGNVGEFVLAFRVFGEAGDQRQADRIIGQASHQAALRGGGAPAIAVFRRLAELAKEAGDKTKEVHGHLALADALRHTGSRDEAAQVLEKARATAQQSNDRHLSLLVEEAGLRLDVPHVSRGVRIGGLTRLHEKYTASGDEFDAARVATILSAEQIGQENFELAEQAARSALEYFDGIGDEYGERIARVNLAVALSGMGGHDREAAEIAQQFDKHMDPVDHPRERAVICNLLTRRYRRIGELTLATQYATEAIEIGRQLGDQHVIAINQTNLGNVRRDEGLLDQALELYEEADLVAAKAGFPRDEASASELIASVLNEKGNYDLALIRAAHASNMARLAGEGLVAARGNQERALALVGQGNIETAVDAYLEAAMDADSVRPGSSFSAMLTCDALNLCSSEDHFVLLKRALSRLVPRSPGEPKDRQGDSSLFSTLYLAIPEMARRYPAERIAPMVALTLAPMFGKTPPPVERRIIRQAADALLPVKGRLASDSVLMGIAGVLLACNWSSLTLNDLVYLAEKLAESSPILYFKPHGDGAAHWTLRLPFSDPVIITLTQMDDSPRTSVTTMMLTLLLAGTSRGIGLSLLGGEQLARREAVVSVVSRADFDANIDPALSDLGDMPQGFTVSQSSDLEHEDQPPTIIICSQTFGSPWHPSRRAVSDIHLLFGAFLRGLSMHFLAREVEEDVLRPKIVAFVRSLGYREGVEIE